MVLKDSASVALYCNVRLKSKKGLDWTYDSADVRTNEFHELVNGRYKHLCEMELKKLRASQGERRREVTTVS